MKKIVVLLVTIVVITGLAGLAQAANNISFIEWAADADSLQGVDTPTFPPWSATDSMSSLGTDVWGLLGGTAWVNGFSGAGTGTLTHRGTRGLGISGGEGDEVDSIGAMERIEVSFSQPQFLSSFEVRSFFNDEVYVEQALVDFYLGTSKFYTENIAAVVPESGGSKGSSVYTYATPKIIDKLDFYVPLGQDYTNNSEFSVAKLNVSAVPEPISAALYVIGAISLGAFGYKRKRRS